MLSSSHGQRPCAALLAVEHRLPLVFQPEDVDQQLTPITTVTYTMNKVT
jgi:hypothetical protein